jgi:formylglycine-generating enzyme required for sulfatase activity
MDWPQTCSGLGLKDPMFQRFFTVTLPAYWLVGPDGRVTANTYHGRGGQQMSSFSSSVHKIMVQFAELAVRMPYYRSGEFLLDLPKPAQAAPPGAADVPGGQLDELCRKAICPPAPGLGKDKQAAAFRETLELARAIEQKYPQAANLPVVRCAMLVAARWLATETPDKAIAKQAQEIASRILESKAQGPPRLLAEYVRASGELAGDGISREESARRIKAFVKEYAGGDLNWPAGVFGVMLATECGDEETRLALVDELGGQVDGHPKVRGFLRDYCNENVDARTAQGQLKSAPEGPTPLEVRGKLPLLGGGTLRLEDLKGKMVVIQFWSTAFPAISPELIAANTRLDRTTKTPRVVLPADLSPDPRYDMVIVGVNLDRSRDDVEKYLKQHSEYKDWVHVFSGLGPDDPLARELDIYGAPRSVLLDREGKIYQWGFPGQVSSGIMYRVFAPQPNPSPNPPPMPLPSRRESKTASGGDAPGKAAPAETPVADLPKEISLDLGGKIAMKLALVPPGAFRFGSPSSNKKDLDDEQPQQWRYLTRPFYMGVRHVTRGEFAAFVRQANYKTEAEREGWALLWNGGWQKVEGASWRNCGFDQGDDHPVVCVSFNDAVEFCNWLGRTSGKAVRLPTETRWEYACRAGTVTPYPWGARAEDGNGWCNAADRSAARAAGDKVLPCLATFDWDDGYVNTSPVGKFKANALGLYDMTGNAWQWCSDWYGSYTTRQRSGYVDPPGPASGTYRVTRGGSWNSGSDYCRSAVRRQEPPAASTNTVGFRIAMDTP